VNDDFLFFENDWMYKKYERLEFVRSPKYYTFKIALNLLLQNGGKTIIETGTMRMHDDPGGCGTLLFGDFCQRYDKHLFTVDNVSRHLGISKLETRGFKDHITYILSDSVKYLKLFYDDINLLYLDSMDCPAEGDATLAQEHQLAEFKAAEKNLKPGSILLQDDSGFANGGKTRILNHYLLTLLEWKLIMDYGQTLWVKVN